MEAFAVGASIIAVIQITDRIIGICKFYIEAAGEAAADLHTMLLEISMLKAIFEHLEFLRTCNNDSTNLKATLTGKNGPIEGCHGTIHELEKLFPTRNVNQSGRSGSKKEKLQQSWQALAWPLKKGRATRLLDEIMRHKTSITLALTTVQSRDIATIKTKTNEMHDMLTDSQLGKVWKWIRRTDPSPLHNRAQKQYEAGTGNWFLRLPEWTAWLTGDIRLLWIHGIPGAGKTVLMSYLIEQVKNYSEVQSEKSTTYSYYYAYFGHNQDEAEPFLRWVIEQVCRKKRKLPTKLYQMYEIGVAPNLSSLLSCLERVIEDLDALYIVLDAVDESSPREDLLKVIRDLATDARFDKIRVLVSSRNYLDIEKTIKTISSPISMSNEFVDDDIRHLVRAKLKSNANFSSWPAELLEEVENSLTKGAEGMFRWVVCQFEVLQRVKNDRKVIQRTLKTLPKTLDETYERIFLEISEEDAFIVQATLRWIHYHSMLQEGKSIPCAILLPGIEEFMARSGGNSDERIDEERIRELCGCLIHMTVENVGFAVHHEIAVVSFAHYTVLEYLISARGAKGPVGYFSLHKEHTVLALMEVVFCNALKADNYITYIAKKRRRNASENFIPPYDHFTYEDFRSYCIVFSILSIRLWPGEISQNQALTSLVFNLLDPVGAHYDDLCTGARSMHGDSMLDLGISVECRFWDLRHNLNKFNKDACHVLNLALLSCNNERVLEPLRKLLQHKDTRSILRSRLSFIWDRSFFENLRSDYHFDGTLLEIFSQLAYDHHDAFKIFLEYSTGLFDPSAVLMLYIGNHEHIIHLQAYCKDYCPVARLLQLGADPNAIEYGLTPLQIAVRTGDFESVRLLLGAGANPNGIGNCDGISPNEDTFVSLFNNLKGASPLCICRNFVEEPFHHSVGLSSYQAEVDAIAALLLDYGAGL